MKYKTGIYIGKFYPLHFGHISALRALSLECQQVYMFFFSSHALEAEMRQSVGYSYRIDDRVSDAKTLLENDRIHILKLDIDDQRKFPENRDSILKRLKELLPINLDVQIFGQEESDFLIPHKYADQYLVASPYTVEDENGKLVSLHSTSVRDRYQYYKKFLPKIIRTRINNLRRKIA